MLVEEGEQVVPFFVVTAGELEVVRLVGRRRVTRRRARPRTVHRRGQHAVGPPVAVRGCARSEPGEVIELDREQLLALVQTDAELSEILMRAFILRRVELVAHGLGDVVLVGSSHSPARCASRSS